MNNKIYSKVHSILLKEVLNYQVPVVDLIEAQTQNPEKVLIGTILSARTNDRETAKASNRLFKDNKINGIIDLKKLAISQIEKIIYPVCFYKNKAKFLHKLPNVFFEKFNNVLPKTIEELILLPGVGRKTANLVLAVGFQIPAICVDTHVHKIMNRFGYIDTKNPLESEMILRDKLPEKYWLEVNRILVAFGQNTCRPTSPHCSICPVSKYCEKIGISSNR